MKSLPGRLFAGLILILMTTSLYSQEKNDSVFTASEKVLKTPTGDIYGTLTIPNGMEKSPVVLIIAGSGPTDRNCNSPMGIETDAYKMLAKAFARSGISTLRYDKRGIGQSKAALASENDIRFDDYVNDAVAWAETLKADPRFTKVIILGHSEGSLIGMIAAQKTKIAGFISLTCAGKPADQIIQQQLQGKLTPELMAESDAILDSLRAGKTVANVNPVFNTLYRPSVQPYLISWMKYDPAKEIAKLTIPVLIIQGSTDLQVTVDDGKLLQEAKPDAKLVVIDGMNHVLKEAPADMQANVATYKDPKLPLKAGLTDDIIGFIKSLP